MGLLSLYAEEQPKLGERRLRLSFNSESLGAALAGAGAAGETGRLNARPRTQSRGHSGPSPLAKTRTRQDAE